MLSDTANLSAAESADLITAARHDGDALTRELAERLAAAEELCDRLGNGDELRAANNLLDLALREKRAADAQVNALRAQLAGAESRVATLAGQLDGAQGEMRSMRARLATAQTEIDNASKRAERHEPFCACGNPISRCDGSRAGCFHRGPSPESRRYISAMAVLAGEPEADALLSDNDADDAAYFAQAVAQ